MDSPEDILPKQSLRVMQILAGALLAGVIVFLIIVLTIVFTRNGLGMAPAADLPIISIVATLVLVVQIPFAFFVPSLQTRGTLQKIASGTWQLLPGANAAAFNSDASKLLALRQSTMITGLAVLEGAAFFCCIAYLLEARPFVLSVVLVVLFLMVASFPTESRVRAWLERQTDQLARLRQQGDGVIDQ